MQTTENKQPSRGSLADLELSGSSGEPSGSFRGYNAAHMSWKFGGG